MLPSDVHVSLFELWVFGDRHLEAIPLFPHCQQGGVKDESSRQSTASNPTAAPGTGLPSIIAHSEHDNGADCTSLLRSGSLSWHGSTWHRCTAASLENLFPKPQERRLNGIKPNFGLAYEDQRPVRQNNFGEGRGSASVTGSDAGRAWNNCKGEVRYANLIGEPHLR